MGTDMDYGVTVSALRDALTIDYRPTLTAVTGLVRDAAGDTYLHTERYVGFYCDETECPDDAADECPAHPGTYWADTMLARYYYATRAAGLTLDLAAVTYD